MDSLQSQFGEFRRNRRYSPLEHRGGNNNQSNNHQSNDVEMLEDEIEYLHTQVAQNNGGHNRGKANRPRHVEACLNLTTGHALQACKFESAS